MSKMTKLALCVTLTMLFAGTYFMVSAAPVHQAGPPRDISNLHLPPPLVNEINKSTFFTTATPYAVLVAGFNVEDGGVQFTCTSGSGTCTLVVNSFATSSAGGLANDDRALCLVVDGAIAGACAYNGYDAADGSYSAISSLNSTVVSAGVHTAYISFYSTSGTTMYTYTNQYNIYKP